MPSAMASTSFLGASHLSRHATVQQRRMPTRASRIYSDAAAPISPGASDQKEPFGLSRRAASISLASLAGSLAIGQASWAYEGPDTTITHKAYLDIGVCVEGNRRADWMDSADGNVFCVEPQSLGRIVIGLYGNAAPESVAAFLSLLSGANGATYRNTTFNRVVQGSYISAGKQGKRRNGEVEGVKLERSKEILSSAAFRLGHERPGTVSWAVGANDDEPPVRAKPGWQNAEFLITSGPKPNYDLDGTNIVVGRVLEGLDVVGDVAASPTFKPAQVLQTYNAIGAAFGDKRANTVRKAWVRPRAPVIITDCGVL